MQVKQTNSAITFLLSEYRSIFKSAYVKGLTAAVAVAAPIVSTQAVAAPVADNGDDLPDIDLSSANFDSNIGAANAAATSADDMRPLTFDNGSSLSYTNAAPAAPAVAAAAPVAAGSRAAKDLTLRTLSGDSTSITVGNNATSSANAVKDATSEVNLKMPLPTYTREAPHYFYYKNSSNKQVTDFINNGTITYDQLPNNPSAATNAVIIAGIEAGAQTQDRLLNSGSINLNGAEGLENAGFVLDKASNPNTKIDALISNESGGTMNITNGDALKIVGNGNSIADNASSKYWATNAGTMNIKTSDTDSNVSESNKLGAAGMHFTGPTKGNASRHLQNDSIINVNVDTTMTDGMAYAAGVVIDNGADNVGFLNNGTIKASSGNYAVFVGNDQGSAVTDPTSGSRVTFGNKSQIEGEVKLNHQTRLRLDNNTDEFVLTTFGEKDANGTVYGDGLNLELLNSKLTMQSGSDATISQFSGSGTSSINVDSGAKLTFNSHLVDSANTQINLGNTKITNKGDTIISGGQTIDNYAGIDNFDGNFTITDNSTLNINGDKLNNSGSGSKFALNSGGKLNINNTAVLNNSAAMTAQDSGSVINIASGGSLINSDTINISKQASLSAEHPTYISNSGNINFSANAQGNLIGVNDFTNTGSITVKDGSNFTATADAATAVDTGAKFANSGYINVNGSSTQAHIGTTTFDNSRNINVVSGGSFKVTGATNGDGTFAADNTFNATKSSTISVSGSGSNIEINAQNFNNDGTRCFRLWCLCLAECREYCQRRYDQRSQRC